MEIYSGPGVRLRLKVRILKAGVIETILYGCSTWSPNKLDLGRLRQANTAYSSDASAGGNGSATATSYADGLAKTASENIEATVRKRRILFAGFVARMGEESLPRRANFGPGWR